ncbi:MAG: pitrilysin family protein [Hyphomicrobiaceae bacterium]
MFTVLAAASRCGELIRGGTSPIWRVAALLAIAVVPAVIAPATAQAQVQATPKASHFKLANGMEVVVVPNHRVPVVTHQVWYKAGGAEDPDNQPGIAHFLEHLMFKGTKTFPGNSFERFVVANGGAGTNAFTYQDLTVYPQSLPKKHLAALMEREADRMVNLLLSDEQIKAEVGVVQNERRGNDNSPLYQLNEHIRAALFPGHPYSRSVIGKEAEIATLDRTKALAFYKRYYAPNNAVLVVAGDVTEGEVRKLAEGTFGRIPANKNLPKRVVQPMPKKPATMHVELEHERVGVPSIGFYYATPGIGVLSEADSTALNLLGHIAGASIIGRLHRSLVTEQKLANSVSAGHSHDLRGGILSFAAAAAPGVAFADLEAALGREIAALGRDGVTAAEVDDARKAFLAAKAYADDNHRVLADSYGRSLSQGLTVADVENEDERTARVTVDDVNRQIARFMAKTEPVIAVLRPKGTR